MILKTELAFNSGELAYCDMCEAEIFAQDPKIVIGQTVAGIHVLYIYHPDCYQNS